MQEKISAFYLRRFSLIERYRRPASGIPKQSAETFLLKMPVVGQYLGQALPPHGLPPLAEPRPQGEWTILSNGADRLNARART